MFDLGIVILSWNTRDLLRNCLRSLFASQGNFTFRVCVVDNASADGSAAMARTEFPQALVIENNENLGYPAGNNVGLRALGFGPPPSPEPKAQERGEGQGVGGDVPRYALLLNPDTVLPEWALADMLAYMDAHPCCGASGPKLILPNGELDLACRRSFPSPEVSFYRMTGLSHLFPRSRLFGRYNMTYLSPDQETEVDSVVGAFMLVRRETIGQVGLLDESFFMYGEDLDWAFAIKQAGWQICYNPAVTVLHFKRAASRQSQRAQVAFHESMLLFYHKHYAAATPWPLGWLVEAGIHLNLAWTKLHERMRPRASESGLQSPLSNS
jgi:N-acetylglucosaminyl-diphospho-decaprenol L-rhamnosyltransferase